MVSNFYLTLASQTMYNKPCSWPMIDYMLLIVLLISLLYLQQKAVQEKYNIPSTQLRIYVHYQPSFYHFHVHFTNLQHSPPGCGTDRAHLLSTVINNLELMNNYYQMSNLNFTIRENDKLFDRYESYGLVKRTATR